MAALLLGDSAAAKPSRMAPMKSHVLHQKCYLCLDRSSLPLQSTISHQQSTINLSPRAARRQLFKQQLTWAPKSGGGDCPPKLAKRRRDHLADEHHRSQASVVTKLKSRSSFLANARNSSSCPINTARRTAESSASPMPGTESGMISTSFSR